jgi:hypothetical protein
MLQLTPLFSIEMGKVSMAFFFVHASLVAKCFVGCTVPVQLYCHPLRHIIRR